MHVDPVAHPLLLSESSFTPKEQREKLMELVLEKFSSPAFFISKEATLSAYASGRATALIVDCGADMTTVTPVHDGYVLQKSILRSNIAGNRLTELVHNAVLSRLSYSVRNKWEITPLIRSHVTTTFHNYQVWEVVNDIKECSCYVAESANVVTQIQSNPTYELPDGTPLQLETDRFRIPEIFFTPQSQQGGGYTQTIPQMITTCIANCDAELRRELYNAVVVTGGTSLFNGFTTRLSKEIEVPQLYPLKTIIPTDTTERRYSSWIGGSILGSLGTFHQMWISKQEYEEVGKELVHKRCP